MAPIVFVSVRSHYKPTRENPTAHIDHSTLSVTPTTEAHLEHLSMLIMHMYAKVDRETREI